eukprot:tig00021535_g22218.t1
MPPRMRTPIALAGPAAGPQLSEMHGAGATATRAEDVEAVFLAGVDYETLEDLVAVEASVTWEHIVELGVRFIEEDDRANAGNVDVNGADVDGDGGLDGDHEDGSETDAMSTSR